MNPKDKLWRPPVGDERRKMILEMTDELNKDSLLVLNPHDLLNMCIDRAYSKMFPGKPAAAKRKKYIKIDF